MDELQIITILEYIKDALDKGTGESRTNHIRTRHVGFNYGRYEMGTLRGMRESKLPWTLT